MKTVMLLRNYSLFLITSKYRFDKLCLYSITEVVFIDDPPIWWRALLTRVGVIKVDGRVLVFPSTRVNVYDPLTRGLTYPYF
jgi:hypothetical protein